jgi:hypothetical protein
MKTPVRWLDDPSLAADLRADLECVQAHPWQPDLARAAATLDAALDAEPSELSCETAPTAEPDCTSTEPTLQPANHAATSGIAPTALLPKLAVITLSGGLFIAAGVWQLQQQPTPTPPAQTTPDEVGPKAIIQPAPEASTTRREIEQLKRIYATLVHNPAEAYRLARASLQEIPRGTLREEREGLAVIALSQSGDRAGARALAQIFLDRYPESALRERIRQLLAGEPTP